MTTLLIDSNAVCHRARFAMKGSNLSIDEMRTEVIFGFMNQIYTLAERFETNGFLFAWDSHESKRRKIYPDYKKKRKEKTKIEKEFDDLTIPQFDRIRCEVLPALGFRNIFIEEGYEADDVIAVLVKAHKDRFTIVSRDNDLYQLLFFAQMYDPQTKKMMTKQTFYKIFDLLPSKWAMVKAMAGCNSDNVKGVQMVGELTAIKYLKNRLNEEAKAIPRIKESKDLVEFNLRLVRLPFEGIKGPFELSSDRLSIRNFVEVFTKLKFRTFLADNEFVKWEKLFKLK